jgi:beta-1,2-mannobiose phosphorylase / 1,2-beta-oligomannan phosphorylase
MPISRCSLNPIIVPGGDDWRKVVTFNPGVLFKDGRFFLYERAAGSLRPFRTCIGLWESTDGIHFRQVSHKPVFTSEMLGLPGGSVQDARVVHIDGTFYLTYAMQPFGFDCYPTGEGLPDYDTGPYPGWNDRAYPMITRSGIAVSQDGIHFTHLCYTSPEEIDDRDHVLFPEKINGRFVLLRRPKEFTGSLYGPSQPGIWISDSEDLVTWSVPKILAVAKYDWEGGKIGAGTNPVKTEKGWLILYHGVDKKDIYRAGAMLLDPEDPSKVIARTVSYIMEPVAYYEKTGLVIPNVVFPTGLVVKDSLLYIYYGCCDSCIGLATEPVDELINTLLSGEE